MTATAPTPTPATANNSTMTSRKAEREARGAAGDMQPARRRSSGFRAGIDAESPLLVVTHVSE